MERRLCTLWLYYRLENGELSIADDEVEVIRVIFDRLIHTNDGVVGIARYPLCT